MLVDIFKKRLVSSDPDGEKIDAQSSDDVGLEIEFCGIISCEKTTVIELELILDFAIFSIHEIYVEFLIGDILAEILSIMRGTSSTLMRSHSFSKEKVCSYFFQV